LRKNIDNSVSHYLDFFRANLNGEKKPERFLGSNLQCCLHATALMAVKVTIIDAILKLALLCQVR
jgi:hypothetical protein